jgi:hypothetical protein
VCLVLLPLSFGEIRLYSSLAGVWNVVRCGVTKLRNGHALASRTTRRDSISVARLFPCSTQTDPRTTITPLPLANLHSSRRGVSLRVWQNENAWSACDAGSWCPITTRSCEATWICWSFASWWIDGDVHSNCFRRESLRLRTGLVRSGSLYPNTAVGTGRPQAGRQRGQLQVSARPTDRLLSCSLQIRRPSQVACPIQTFPVQDRVWSFPAHTTCTSRWCSTRKFRSPPRYSASSASDNQTNAQWEQFAAPQWIRRSSVRVWFVAV